MKKHFNSFIICRIRFQLITYFFTFFFQSSLNVNWMAISIIKIKFIYIRYTKRKTFEKWKEKLFSLYLCFESIFRTSSFFFNLAKRSFGVNIWSSLSKSINRSGISTLSGLYIYWIYQSKRLSFINEIFSFSSYFFINCINIEIFSCFSRCSYMWIWFKNTLNIVKLCI